MQTHTRRVKATAIRQISFEADPELPEFLASWLLDWLGGYLEDGVDIRDEETLEFGFWLLLCRLESDRLRLLAPDFNSQSRAWQQDLSHVLHSMMVHKYLPESFGADMYIPRMNETAIVGKRSSQFPMFIDRLVPVDNGVDSGWFVGSSSDEVDNNDPNQLSVETLLDVLFEAPWIHDFLSLPVGMQVVFDTKTPVVLKNFEPVPVCEGSYFETRYSDAR